MSLHRTLIAVVFGFAATSCGGDDPHTCLLGGESCDSFAFYKVTEDRPLFEEPGPHGYMLLIRARIPGGEAYFEYAEQGQKTASSVETIVLDDPREGLERPYPPITHLLVPESHPRAVEGSIHWYGWGEVTRDVDFEARTMSIEFGPMTFLNQTSGEEWVLDEPSTISSDLDVLCWNSDQEPADSNSEFCRDQLP